MSREDHYRTLREFRDTAAFGRLRRYLGRRRQSVSFKPRGASILRGESNDGDQVEVAVAPVEIRNGHHDEAYLILGRAVDGGDLIAAGIEYVETERRTPEAVEAGSTSPNESRVTVCVSVKAVDALDGLSEEDVALTPRRAATQAAD